MKNKSVLIPACIAAIALYAPTVGAAEAKTASSSAPNTTTSLPVHAALPVTRSTSERAFPFHGIISASDEKAKTFTIPGKEHARTFKVTEKTVLTKAGAPATIKDATVNEEVRGSYWKAPDGTLEARTVKLGPRTEAEKSRAKKHQKKKASKSDVAAAPETSLSGKP